MMSTREERQARADERRRSMRVELHTLESSPPATATTAEERVAMVWPITCDVWAMSGREMPAYERKEMPVRVLNLKDLEPSS